MIGVLAKPTQRRAVQEFFELFKTPWEFYRDGCQYEVLICTVSAWLPNNQAKLTMVYCGQRASLDVAEKVGSCDQSSATPMLIADDMRIPIYADAITFDRKGFLFEENSGLSAAYVAMQANGDKVIRVGYDLFDEVEFLLVKGQPLENSRIPTLELHIALLRKAIVEHGASVVEIPPIPDGYQFIACLTHDVDHPSIRLHRLDHTMFGFVYRATVGSFMAALWGRTSLQDLRKNWVAVLKMPFVYFGWAKDFWNDFGAYAALEGEVRSSFFVIPFKGRAGQQGARQAPAFRASGYGAADISSQIRDLLALGHEIGLHGIDAWNDVAKAREETDELRHITASRVMGVRMHWLYFDEQSPAILDRAGVDYDSSIGYNDAVGYRAGTAQVYKPLSAVELLELPLHIMDTALFLPGRQNLSTSEAKKLVGEIVANAVRFGGVITVNWHDRSILPERLWAGFYSDLLQELRAQGAWLASARDTVRWFRKRRSAIFVNKRVHSEPSKGSTALPEMSVRIVSAPKDLLSHRELS
jgi:peptidoglycan/xylan/chitin deacetylase (PgdA/CDA1 family)